MIKKLNNLSFFVAVLVALSACASVPSVVTTVNFTKNIMPDNRICSIDSATVNLTSGKDLALEKSILARMESNIKDAIYTLKKDTSCKTNVARNYVLDAQITQYTEGGVLGRLLAPEVTKVQLNGNFVLNDSSVNLGSIAEFSVINTSAWGGQSEKKSFLHGLFGSSTPLGGELGSAASLEIIEDTFAEDVAKKIVAVSTGEKSIDKSVISNLAVKKPAASN